MQDRPARCLRPPASFVVQVTRRLLLARGKANWNATDGQVCRRRPGQTRARVKRLKTAVGENRGAGERALGGFRNDFLIMVLVVTVVRSEGEPRRRESPEDHFITVLICPACRLRA